MVMETSRVVLQEIVPGMVYKGQAKRGNIWDQSKFGKN